MSEDTKLQILQLEETLKTATLQNDAAVTGELLANDWININATGTVTTKEQTLAIMSKFRFLSIENEEVDIRLYPGVAIVTGLSTRQLEGGSGETLTSRVLFTRIYAKPYGRWQVFPHRPLRHRLSDRQARGGARHGVTFSTQILRRRPPCSQSKSATTCATTCSSWRRRMRAWWRGPWWVRWR